MWFKVLIFQQCILSNISKIVYIFVYLIPIPQLVAKLLVFNSRLENNCLPTRSHLISPVWFPLMTGCCCLVVRSSLCLWMRSMALLKLPSPMETARMALACKRGVSLVLEAVEWDVEDLQCIRQYYSYSEF